MPRGNADSRVKARGRVYTPVKVVDEILDLAGYAGPAILRRHVVDNSCGDGAFLTRVVRRYCEAAQRSAALKQELETYIHGIELDPAERKICLERLDSIAAEYGLDRIQWDVVCDNALTCQKYDGKMDYVVGNPPYVRVHNLGLALEQVKSYEFGQGGMTDLYLVFYEIGMRMLKKEGVLGYITPSSFFNSVAGKSLRKRLVKERALKVLVDMKHAQVFNAATYTTIVVLQKDRLNDDLELYDYNGAPVRVDSLSPSDYYYNDKFYFGSREQLAALKKIFELGSKKNRFAVKNGFATLADKFFIVDEDLPRTIPVVKASTGKLSRCIFPYQDGKLLPREILFQDEALARRYAENETALKARSLPCKDDWVGFGRTQGLLDVGRNKYAVNTLIRGAADIKLTPAPPGTGVYGGLYILSDLGYDELLKLLTAREFIDYVVALKKYKSGGYYAFSSKDLKIYLEYAADKADSRIP